jgi:hypothetical protein
MPPARPWDDSVVAMKDKLKANHGQLQQQLLDEKATVVKLVNDVSRLTEELAAVQECRLEEMKRAHARDQQLTRVEGPKIGGCQTASFQTEALRTELRSYSPPGYKSYLTSGAVISRHIAALHVIHKYIHNSSIEF